MPPSLIQRERSSPQPLEAPPCRAGIMDGVLGIAMAEVVLDGPQLRFLVGEAETAGVAQGVWVDTLQPGTLGRRSDEVVDRLAGEWLSALGQEQPRQLAPAHGEVAADRAQLVAGDRLLDRQPALETAYPQPGAIQV